MVLFLDGASHYNSAIAGKKWTAIDTTLCTVVQATEGRLVGGGCLKKTATADGVSGFLTFAPTVSQDGPWTPTRTGVFAHAVKIDSLATVEPLVTAPTVFDLRGALFTVYSGIWCMFAVGVNTNGTLSVYTRNGGLLGNSIQAFTDGVWVQLQYKWTTATDTSTPDGALEIRANGQPILTLTNVILSTGALGFPAPVPEWNAITVLGVNSTPGPPFLVMRQCDVFLFDDVASPDPANPNNDFIGDKNIKVIRPRAPGALSGWTASAGANWDAVREIPPDDVARITASVAGTRDTYPFEAVIGNPVAIQHCVYVKKDLAAAAELKATTRIGGVNFDSPAQGIGDTSYQYRLYPQDVDPSTSLQYTEAGMNAAEHGPTKSL